MHLIYSKFSSLLLILCSSGLFAQMQINASGNIGVGSDGILNQKMSISTSSERYTLFVENSNYTSGLTYGIFNRMVNGRGLKYGLWNELIQESGSGYSTYSILNFATNYGGYNNFGTYNRIYEFGYGDKRGVYNWMSDNHSASSSSTNSMFGVYNYLEARYRPQVIGTYTKIDNINQSSGDAVYGIKIEESGDGAAVAYGVYSAVNSPQDYAAYFIGEVAVNGSTVHTSDRALKTEIDSISKAIDIIRALKPSKYKIRTELKNEKGGKYHYGFVAQDVEQVLPELVVDIKIPTSSPFNDRIDPRTDTIEAVIASVEEGDNYPENGTIKGVRYMDLIAVLAQALKEEDAVIDSHREKLKKEKEKGDKLQQEIDKLQDLVLDLSNRISLLEQCTECSTEDYNYKNRLQKKTQSTLQERGYKIYPNPTVDQVNVEGPIEENTRVYIYDSNGRKILDLPFTNGRGYFQIGNLSSGTYFLEMFNEKEKVSYGTETVILR